MARRISNPPNPWAATDIDWLGEPPTTRVDVYEEEAKSLLSRNDSPDLPFDWSANPYRGCAHACSYCYARPTHQYLGYGAGTDFDARLIVKRNAPELLERELTRPSWQGDSICFSGITDCYQPLEASYRLTQRCLEVCLAAGNPVAIITKGALVRRDVQLLAELQRVAGSAVTISIPFIDAEMGRALEPGAPSPVQRLQSVRVLADAGVPVGVTLSPLIPGLNDSQVPEVLERAAECGATYASCTLLRLPAEVKPVFMERLQSSHPDRYQRVLSGIREMREGDLYRSGFGTRMRGSGDRWNVLMRLFEVTCRRIGLELGSQGEGPRMPPKRPRARRQLDLFDPPLGHD